MAYLIVQEAPTDGTPSSTGGTSDGTPAPPPPASQAPEITTTTLPDGSVATPYSQTLTTAYGTAPLAFAITAGALPAGLTLAADTGIISGTPTAIVDATFVVTVSDAAGLSGSSTLSIAIPSAPSILNTALPAGIVGEQYAASLQASGGTAPYGFRLVGGSLPAGLALAATGGITGIPTTAETSAFAIQVYDSNSPQGTATVTYAITITGAQLTATVRSLDECVLLGGEDGALYMIVPGQRYDETYDGEQVGFFQQWRGVETSGGKMALNQLGGATVGAKGSGLVNVSAIDDAGNTTALTTERRPFILAANDDGKPIEVTRDLPARAVGKSPRFGISIDNGAVAGAWFEAHVAILWIRAFFTGRKA